MVKVKRLFKANCGPGARYLRHSVSEPISDGMRSLVLQFEMIPEGRQFNLDHAVRGPADSDLEVAVLKLAAIARDVRNHIAVN